MKCLTLNAHSWLGQVPLKRLFDLAEHILEMDYDIICLQEINQRLETPVAQHLERFTALADFPKVHEDNYALYLVNYLKKKGKSYYWSWVYNHLSYDSYNEGVALLSKTPFEAQDLLVSARDNEFDYHTRRVLLATTEINGRPMTVVNLHLSQEQEVFQQEWQRLEQELLTKPQPYLLLGNFNAATGSKGYELITKSPLDLQDCHQVAKRTKGEATVPEKLGGQAALRLDYVFVSRDFEVEAAYVSFDGGNAPIVSDHYGVAVEISLED